MTIVWRAYPSRSSSGDKPSRANYRTGRLPWGERGCRPTQAQIRRVPILQSRSDHAFNLTVGEMARNSWREEPLNGPAGAASTAIRCPAERPAGEDRAPRVRVLYLSSVEAPAGRRCCRFSPGRRACPPGRWSWEGCHRTSGARHAAARPAVHPSRSSPRRSDRPGRSALLLGLAGALVDCALRVLLHGGLLDEAARDGASASAPTA